MAKKFENKKLNKDDHKRVDKEAGVARGLAGGAASLGTLYLMVKKVPWKKVGSFIGKKIFKA